ncbi:MAG: hypothetical protein GY704_17010, partial [Phycisphaeraceae bacterium]|nr:hypothetical protein [Phycisphaeraceae bacterium]
RFRQILPACKDESVRAEIAGRIDDIERSQALLARLRATARDEPKRLGVVSIAGLNGKVTGGDEGCLLVTVRGAVVRRRWAELEVGHLVVLIRKLALEPDDLLSLAILRFDRNDRDGWMETLAEAMETSELKDTIDALYARKEGIPVPAGGFVSHRGRILSRSDFEREKHEEAISELLQEFAAGLDRLDQLPTFKGVGVMKKKHEALVLARKHALALIFDEKTYFYPYRHRMAEYTPVQKDVDGRVGAVRVIWDNPLRISLRHTPEATTLVRKLRAKAESLRAKYRYNVRPLTVALNRRT